MKRLAADWQRFDDVRRHEEARDFDPTAPGVDCRVSPNVGEMMAAAMAAAGQNVLRLGGATACETDYLAACGATFPADVPIADLVAFNCATLRADMDEYHEMRRYAAIAGFFRRSRHAT